MRFPNDRNHLIEAPQPGIAPLPPIPPPPTVRRVSGEFTEKLDLFIPDQESAYDVSHFNYNFEILSRFSSRMMFAGYVDPRTRTTTYLSVNAKLLLRTIALKHGVAVSAIDEGHVQLVGANTPPVNGVYDIGSPQTHEGNYYIVIPPEPNGDAVEGEMFGLSFRSSDWLVATGEGWAKINNNGDGVETEIEIQGSQWIEVKTYNEHGVEDPNGKIKKIFYKETWEPFKFFE